MRGGHLVLFRKDGTPLIVPATRINSDNRSDDENWVTINGTHVPLDDSGNALAGGALKGKNFSGAKSEKPGRKSAAKPGGSKIKANEASKSIRDAFESDDSKEIANAVDKAMEEMPVGSTMFVNGMPIRKTGDGQFEAEEPWGGNAPITPVDLSDYICNYEGGEISVDFDIPDKESTNRPIPTTKENLSQYELSKLSDADRIQLIKDIKAENPNYWMQGNGTMTNYIASEYGLNQPPELMEGSEFDRYVRESGSTMIWRGIRDNLSYETDELLVPVADIVREFATEDKNFSYGGGNYGSGYHFTTDKEIAEGFGSSTSMQEGRVLTCALKPDAKVVSYDRASREGERLGIDASLWALLNGYDATSSNTGVYNVLNRGSLVMKKSADIK